MNSAQSFGAIVTEHNKYLGRLADILSLRKDETTLEQTERIDRLLFHIIEEIIEARRNYDHKFWKQTREEFTQENGVLLLGELADVFLMFRSAYLEACKLCKISEAEFLETYILSKAVKNNERIDNGY